MLYRFLIVFTIVHLIFGCANMHLNADEVFNPPSPNPLVFRNPICLKLHFKTNQLDLFNNMSETTELDQARTQYLLRNLSYYNIAANCENPVAEFTVVKGDRMRNAFPKTIWATVFWFSLGLIPAYVDNSSNITIIENGNLKVDRDYSMPKFAWAFTLPMMISQQEKARNIYGSDSNGAFIAREVAIAIREALKNRGIALH